MGTPDPYIPALYDFAGNAIATIVRDWVPSWELILDVGAGWGKYRWLLPEYQMDAVEAWEPNIKESKLDVYYANVYRMPVQRLSWAGKAYGAVIFGDVLEHLPVSEAQHVIRAACAHSKLVIVAVPYNMEQHPEDGNPYEEHIQADLDRAVMESRYPELVFHTGHYHPGSHEKAIWTNGGPWCGLE